MLLAVWLKRGTLAFWALWLTIVTLSNVADLLKALGVLGGDWRFASGNYAMVAKAMDLYRPPEALLLLTFAAVILWEAAAAVLLWRAAAVYRGATPAALRAAYLALGVMLALWGAFQVMEELTLQYEIEATHRQLFTSTLATLLLVGLLPERTTTAYVG